MSSQTTATESVPKPAIRKPTAAGGFPAIWYTLRKGRESGGLWRMWKALRAKNACKTCALGMGGQAGGMVNERGAFPEVCKKSVQAMAADMQGRVRPEFLGDFSFEKMRALSPRELEAAGRIDRPLYAGALDQHYRPIEWDEAMAMVADRFRAADPARSFWYFSGRSSNEAAFLLQLLARLYGTNNVNNCSYYCHQASGVGLTSVTGSGTATVSLDDLDECDCVILIGGNPASNHPRFMRTLMDLKRRGGTVLVINPLRELGLERFKVPSDPRSLMFGTTIADEYLQPRIGSDVAVMLAMAKSLRERTAAGDGGATDEQFLRSCTEGADAWIERVDGTSWQSLLDASGVTREEIERAVDVYRASQKTIFAWTMGITHHLNGAENVQTIGALAMLRGMLGRPGAGLLPLRGHSNVQGVGSVGVTPVLKPAIAEALEARLGVRFPAQVGMDTMACMDAAERGEIDVALSLGGNLFGSNPDAGYATRSLAKIGFHVQLSTTLNTGHVHGRGRENLILPVRARDEEAQTTTQESMFNFVRLSDGGAARLDGPRAETDIVCDLGASLCPDAPLDWHAMRDHRAIRELIAEVVPGYGAIGSIDRGGKEFTIEGRVFHEPRFATDSGRARFHVVDVPRWELAEDELIVMTIRSEGQFNTVVYEEEDIYRGQERRDVILMNAEDIARLGFRIDDRVTVRTETGSMSGILVREAPIARGCAAMYYPEANVIVPRAVDSKSKTPAFKNVRVRVVRD